MNAHLSSTPAQRQDIARAFEHLKTGGAVPAGTPAQMLAGMRAFVDRYGDVEPRQPTPGVTCQPVDVGSTPCEWLVPAGHSEPGGRIVLLHGGGWVAGSLHSHRPVASQLALRSGWPVLVVGYRLAPEHAFPAALDDCAQAVEWAWAHGPQDASDAPSLALVGDSAGGNLAAATCVRALSTGRRLPSRLALMSAVLEGRPGQGRRPHRDAQVSDEAIAGVLAMYSQGQASPDHAWISPMVATDECLAQFPPTLLQASLQEALYTDAERFFMRLRDLEVRSALSTWPGLPHGWHCFIDLLPEARQALAEVASFCVASG
jgi:acetyl esterase/lipase